MKNQDFKKIIEMLQSNDLDISGKSITFHHGELVIFYIKELVDRSALSEKIILPLITYSAEKVTINAEMAVNNIIFADECRLETDTSQIEDNILAGMVVILFSNDDQYIMVNFKKVAQRGIPTPELTYTVRGAQDCFNENLDTNIALIRYRIKDKNLRIKNFIVGRRTRTRVAVLYIEDIVNATVITKIENKIKTIDIDGIGESGELQKLLCDKKQIFPQMGLIERSDMAFHSLLEGKVVIIVDGSGIALLAPKTFSEFLYSCDDRYDNKYFGLFSRIMRYMALLITFTGSSLFVAITSFHTDVLPSDYAIALAQMRLKVPFSALVGILLLEFIVELLRESLIRIPKHIGPAIGIVGATIIGQAATAAGIFSPLALIIVATSLLSSFAIPDYTIVTPFRILKFGLIISTGFLGFYGFTIFIVFILAELVSLDSFGVPYFAPWAPFNMYDFKRTLMKDVNDQKRPHYLKTKDKIRTKNKADK